MVTRGEHGRHDNKFYTTHLLSYAPGPRWLSYYILYNQPPVLRPTAEMVTLLYFIQPISCLTPPLLSYSYFPGFTLLSCASSAVCCLAPPLLSCLRIIYYALSSWA